MNLDIVDPRNSCKPWIICSWALFYMFIGLFFFFCAMAVRILTAVSSPQSWDPSLKIPQEVLTQEFIENDCFPLEFTWHHCVWPPCIPCTEGLRTTSSNFKHLLRVFLSFVWLMDEFFVGFFFFFGCLICTALVFALPQSVWVPSVWDDV